jgi:aminopeptidase N
MIYNKALRLTTNMAAAILLAAFSIFAQQPRPNFNRPQTFEAQNYTIRASFDRAREEVFGDTTVSVKPLKADFKILELDAVDLTFESVKLDPSGVDLQYKTDHGKIIITLDKTYGPDDLISVRLKYATVKPAKGVYFRDADGHPAQVWSQGEAEEARYWFPCFDFPSDKATTEEYITAPKGEVVIGNGELVGTTANADDTQTWHYKMPVPHSTYLVSFIVGNYGKVDDRYKAIPLAFYVFPGMEGTARNAFGDTKKMMQVYEQLTGVAFPYNKYDQTIVSGFQFGGMENITATTFSDLDIIFGEALGGKGSTTDLVSHELAHSWFGDLVTCRNWAELWLNEGFATYMEAAYREKTFGRDDYINKIKDDAETFLNDDSANVKRHPLYDLNAGNVNALFEDPATTYNKGGAVLHTLREQVGTEAFWKALNIYLNRHKFANVESTDLRAAMEEASGQDLGWFFDQWVYGGGAPKLDVRQVWHARTKTLNIMISQTQGDAITPAVFRLPIEIKLNTPAGEAVQKIDVTKREQSFGFKLDARPARVQIDPEDKIPVKRVKIHPIVSLK